MSDLLEHILTDDYVSATELFEARLNDIREKKLYEMKQDIQAEAFGGLTKADIEARRKAGYVKASEVLPDPREQEIDFKINHKPKKKITTKRKKKLSEDTPIPASGLRIGAKRIAAQQAAQDAEAEKTPEKPKSVFDVSKMASLRTRPGMLKRNLNTLLGRKAGYVKSATPDDQKGGRLGKAVRGTVTTTGKVAKTAGRVGLSFINNLGEDSE